MRSTGKQRNGRHHPSLLMRNCARPSQDVSSGNWCALGDYLAVSAPEPEFMNEDWMTQWELTWCRSQNPNVVTNKYFYFYHKWGRCAVSFFSQSLFSYAPSFLQVYRSFIYQEELSLRTAARYLSSTAGSRGAGGAAAPPPPAPAPPPDRREGWWKNKIK